MLSSKVSKFKYKYEVYTEDTRYSKNINALLKEIFGDSRSKPIV